MKELKRCSDIEGEVESPNARPYNLVLFHMPKEEDDPNNFGGKGISYYVMTEFAKHEKFLYDHKDVGFYFIENVSCNGRYGLQGADTVVMFLRKDKPDGTSERLPHLANNFDTDDF